ncbi:hypothetical protein HY408_00880 [Candidatus Gottesmanbacteria bacterium]|nr:hypothetical protein [Candidatus Gottesmanbacteria bacterium]
MTGGVNDNQEPRETNEAEEVLAQRARGAERNFVARTYHHMQDVYFQVAQHFDEHRTLYLGVLEAIPLPAPGYSVGDLVLGFDGLLNMAEAMRLFTDYSFREREQLFLKGGLQLAAVAIPIPGVSVAMDRFVQRVLPVKRKR